MNSAITMNNGVNAWRIMLRENRVKHQNIFLNLKRFIQCLLIKQSKISKLSTKKLSLKLDKNCLKSLALICYTSKTKLVQNFKMKLSHFRILTHNLFGLRPLILFAVLSCVDWTLFACSASIYFLLITFLRQ